MISPCSVLASCSCFVFDSHVLFGQAVATVFLDMLVSQLQSLRSMATTAMLFLFGWKESSPQEQVSGRHWSLQEIHSKRFLATYSACKIANSMMII